MRTYSIRERRRLLVQRHYLRGDAEGPEHVTEALIALHATDPATVYLSVLARTTTTTIADVAAAIYEKKNLVRWMAMRRTLFVFPTTDVPTIQAAVSTPLAATLRRQLISRLRRNGSEPAIDGDTDAWLDTLEADVEVALRRTGAATGAQLAAAVPALRTTIRPGSTSEKPQNVTSPLLTITSTAGRMVRGAPTGPWTSRHHLWEPITPWWPNGLPLADATESQRSLARRWLERVGPATIDDFQWWTGWNQQTTRAALRTLPIEDIDLYGKPGIAFDNNFRLILTISSRPRHSCPASTPLRWGGGTESGSSGSTRARFSIEPATSAQPSG